MSKIRKFIKGGSMEEELECCDCECGCKTKKVLKCVGLILAGASLLTLGTCIAMKVLKNKEN